MTETNVTEVLVQTPTNNSSTIVEEMPQTGTPLATSNVDAAPPEPPVEEEPKEDPKFAARFAALSRKEKELIQRERQFKENQAKLQAYEKAVATAKQNPIQYLQAAGLTLEEALQYVINDESPDPNSPEVKLKTIEQKIAAYENEMRVKAQQAQQAQINAQMIEFKNGINKYITDNSEQYELIKEHKAIDDVFNVMYRTWQETNGQVSLTLEQAAQAVEEQLLKEEEENAARLLRVNKLKSKFLPVSSTEGTVKVSNQDKVSKPAPTLTNQSVSATTEPRKFKSREESLAEAAKLLKWK